jgi:hypothetical protein
VRFSVNLVRATLWGPGAASSEGSSPSRAGDVSPATEEGCLAALAVAVKSDVRADSDNSG